jgi:TrmH family RNA methyltransferase
MITSGQNPKIKLVRALLGRAKDRREAGAFVAEGVRLLEEAAAAGWGFRFALHDGSLSERGKELVERLALGGVEVDEISTGLMKSLAGTETPQGLLAVLDFAELPIPSKLTYVLIVDQIRDPGNLGTLLRTAAAAGVDAVLIPPQTADAFAPKVLRSGMGAHFSLPVREMSWKKIQQTCAAEGLKIFLADMGGLPCWEVDLRSPLALIIGGEAQGASEEARALAPSSLSVPMPGRTESLNAAAAGAVLMFEVVRQRTARADAAAT